MEALNVRHAIRDVSRCISQAFNTVWHPALLSKLSAGDTSEADYALGLPTCSTHVADMWLFTESFHLLSPLKLKSPKAVILGLVLFLIFINDSLENPLYIFADVSTLCRDIPRPSDRQQPLPSPDLEQKRKKESQPGKTLGIRFSILTNLSLPFSLSMSKDHLANPPFNFHNNPLEEV